MTGRWWTYLRERSPIPLLVIIAGGQAVSGSYLFRRHTDWAVVFHAALGIAGLLVLMRLMDEVKDEAKDRVAHPERPLPRGLLTAREVRRAIVGLGVALLLFGLGLYFHGFVVAAGLFALTIVYAFLMYREFFAHDLLARNAWVYSLSHQVIVIPMYLFAVALAAHAQAFSAPAIWFALTGLGASFVVEVGRKLDPAADPILGTYLRMYGRNQVTVALTAGLVLLTVSAHMIGLLPIVLPFILLVAITLPLIYQSPARFKVIEGATALLALVQMFAPTLRHLWLYHVRG